jgi:transposase-like protein
VQALQNMAARMSSAQLDLRPACQNRYKALMLDGVVLSRKTGAGALRGPVLVALGCATTARRRSTTSAWWRESAAEWEKFLADGASLLAALPSVFHGIAVRRCWAHKIRNVLDKVGMNAANAPAARSAARRFAERFSRMTSSQVIGPPNCVPQREV